MKQYVYIIRGGEFVKIGVAKNPEKRLKQMQTGAAHELEIVALLPFDTRETAFEYENHLHRRLKRFHYRGEWFRAECLSQAFQQAPSEMSDKKRTIDTILDERWQRSERAGEIT